MSTFRVTCIYAGTNDPAKQTQRIEVTDGTTYREVIGRCGFPTDGIHVNVNHAAQKNLDAPAGNADLITVTRIDLKGAAVDFQAILDWGTGDAKVAEGAVAEAMAERTKKAAEIHKGLIGEVLDIAQTEMSDANTALVAAKKALANAEERVTEGAYAIGQLDKRNIFSVLAFAGRKDLGAWYCSKMGCAVLANNSPLWATSPPKAADVA
jgi:hypothetical protein